MGDAGCRASLPAMYQSNWGETMEQRLLQPCASCHPLSPTIQGQHDMEMATGDYSGSHSLLC